MPDTPAPPQLSVIIVNYNTSDFIGRCLESVTQQQGISCETIVVDNASVDGSVELIQRRFPMVRIIANPHNAGFAAANNQALVLSRGRYLFFLNPDTTLSDGCLEAILNFMAANPSVGIAGTAIFDPDGVRHPSVHEHYAGGKRARPVSSGLAGKIAWVLGAAMAAPADVIRRLNGFDERFFLYGEEQDLCLRVRQSGYSVGYIPAAGVTHWGGKSERRHALDQIFEKKFIAEYQFFHKHYPPSVVRHIWLTSCLQAVFRLLSLYPLKLLGSETIKEIEKRCKYRTFLRMAPYLRDSSRLSRRHPLQE
jgi:GT2 family glycosyltransferase